MDILHISTECYPAAKAGGLGDVVGALPKYLNQMQYPCGVIIPKYRTKWILSKSFEIVYSGLVRMHNVYVPFSIQFYAGDELGFPLYVTDIPGLYDRPGVYLDDRGRGYNDQVERAIVFQQAALQWIMQLPQKPKALHCHDHHTGLIPFMVKYCPEFQSLAQIPTLFTIHNGAYHGAFSWEKMYLLPFFEANAKSILDWDNAINPLATGIKCCWKLTTVSPGYLGELMEDSNGLETLIGQEWRKAHGILNGIDYDVWNPKKDDFLPQKLKKEVRAYKEQNKSALLEKFHLFADLPIISFIGRLVHEKGADLLPGMISRFLMGGGKAGFVVLGTGTEHLHGLFLQMKRQFPGYFDVALEYNEGLAHLLYAGSDFLIMPSRVEPCGLNQMYALRYGTVPIVRAIGGLKDTIPDYGDPGGRGIRFLQLSVEDGLHALRRAAKLYSEPEVMAELIDRNMQVDLSWHASAQQYINLYNQVVPS